MVEQTARCADDEMRGALQLAQLVFNGASADDVHRVQSKRFRKGAEHVEDLAGELAGGRHDEGLHAVVIGPDAVDERQQVGEGLARAGLRAADHVRTLERGGNGFQLDPGGRGDPFPGEAVRDGPGQAQREECVHMSSMSNLFVSEIRCIISQAAKGNPRRAVSWYNSTKEK